MKILGNTLIISVLTLVFCISNAYCNPPQAQPVESDTEIEEVEEKSAFEKHEKSFEKKKSKHKAAEETVRFKSYGPFKKDINSICVLILEDQQLNWLTAKSQVYAKSIDNCLPCKTLYATITSACKIKKPLIPAKTEKDKESKEVNDAEEEISEEEANSENGEGEDIPAPTPTPVEKKLIQRLDPSTELIDYVSRTFIRMAETEPRETAEGYYTGVEHLISEMRISKDKSKLEREYYSTLADFIEAPFKSRGFIHEDASGKSAPKVKPTPSVSLDQLF